MKEKLLIITFLINTIILNGQIIDRITFNCGFTNSDLEWDYEQDNTFPIYTEWGQQNTQGFYSGFDIDYLGSKFLILSTGFGFYQKRSIRLYFGYSTKMAFRLSDI